MSDNNQVPVVISEDSVKLICKRHFQSINSYSENNQLNIKSFVVKPLSDKPIGFLGGHYILTVVFNSNDRISSISGTTGQSEISFFIKKLPNPNHKQFEYVTELNAFGKEVNFFEKLIPKLRNFGNIEWSAKCYFIEKDNFLLFENLIENGFHMLPDNNYFDFQHMKIAIETLGRFHAASIILEENGNFQIPEKYLECVKENSYPRDEKNVRIVGFKNAISALLGIIERIPKYQKDYQVICEKFPNLMKKIFEFCEPSKIYRNVVSHGDLWCNNLMFSYKNDEPINARLVDFQLTRYATPALDLMTLIYNTTDKRFRDIHLETFNQIYYTSLQNELITHRIDAEKVITSKEFSESCELYQLAGLIEGCLFCHMTLLPEDITRNLLKTSDDFDNFIKSSRSEICLLAFETDFNYRERMSDLLCNLIDSYACT